MIGKFYGLTGVNLVLSPLSKSTYLELVQGLDTISNREILSVLKRDLYEITKFLDSLPWVYENAEARRADAKLRKERYKDENEKKELEEFLKTQHKLISKSLGDDNGVLNRVSDLAYAIITELNNRRSILDFYYNKINYSEEDKSGVSAFGQTLYLLEISKPLPLVNRVSKIYKTSSGKTLSKELKRQLYREVDTLSSYLVDEENEDVPVTSKYVGSLEEKINNLETMISTMDYNYFNNILGVDYSVEDYHKASLELYNIGLVGFTPYTLNFYKDFKESVVLSDTTDLVISSKKNKYLYSFTLGLQEVVDSFKYLES